MVSLEEIEKTISELEGRDTSFANCEKLAWLYIVRDHLKNYQTPTTPMPFETFGNSEFLQAVNGKGSQEVLAVIDELMETLKAIYPRAYDSVILRIESL